MLMPQFRSLFGILCSLSLSVAASSCSTQRQSSTPDKSQQATAHTGALVSNVTSREAIPPYKHIFVIIAENKGYDQIIGNPNAPVLNQLAELYGLAANFYGEVHPSEANYVAILGGSTFGIHDDDAYYCQPQRVDPYCSHSHQADYVNHTIASMSLPEQLEQHGLTWKGYFEDIPAAGSKVVVAPDAMNALYAAKHNGFLNFKSVQDDPQLSSKIVGLDQLTADLQNNNAPSYSHIVLNQCHEMHGLPQCSGLQQLIKTGDAEIGNVVDQITHSALWSGSDNNAIVITWDEDDGSSIGTQPQGCCGFDPNSRANFGGGHIATIVVTNHGPRGRVDRTPYNHYSLLRTTEEALGIDDYLNEAARTDKGVKSMVPLFATSNN
jgi:phospholipase C